MCGLRELCGRQKLCAAEEEKEGETFFEVFEH